MKLKYSIATLLVGLCLTGKANNGVYTFSENRIEKRAYKVDKSVTVEIENKYGDIIFTTWNKDSVFIEVEIISEGDKIDQVLENLDAVQIDFLGNSTFVEARTEWASNMSFIQKSVAEIRQSLKSSMRVQINYKVTLPSTADLHVSNHFGNTYLSDHKGELRGDISHGNLKGGDVFKVGRLKMKYGDLRLKKVKSANIDMSFGDLEIESCDDLRVSSLSVHAYIESVQRFQVFSKNDHYNVTEVFSMSGTMSLGDCRIKILRRDLVMDSKFQDLHVLDLDPMFKKIDLSGSYTNYYINTPDGVNSSFRVTLENGKGFIHGNNVSVQNEERKDKVEIHSGTIGNGRSGIILIWTKNGEVEFR